MDFLFWLIELSQGREAVIVFGNVRIVNRTIMIRHFQGGVSQQSLEHERIPTAIYQILAGEGVAIQMGRGFLHPSGLIVPSNRQPQTIHGEHPTILVAV